MDEDLRELLLKKKTRQAFDKMVDLYRNKVFRLAVSMLHNEARAEEATQSIFLKLWQVLPAYDGSAAPYTWIYTIARNTCLTEIRAHSYRRTELLDHATEPVARERTLERLQVEQMLDRLPEEQREVIVLFYLQEQSVEDVAAMLDMPAGTVKSHLHRARRAMAQMMKG